MTKLKRRENEEMSSLESKVQSVVGSDGLRTTTRGLPSPQDLIRKNLWRIYESRRATNPKYRVGMLAKDMGIYRTMISELMSGSRFVSKRWFEKRKNTLGFTEETNEQISRAFDLEAGEQRLAFTGNNDDADRKLKIRFVSSNIHHVVIQSVSLSDCIGNCDRMAERIGISRRKLDSIVKDCVELGYLYWDNAGILRRTSPARITMGKKDVPSKQELARIFKKNIRDFYERPDSEFNPSFTHHQDLVFKIGVSDAPKFKEAIRKFYKELDRLQRTMPRDDEIFRVSTSFTKISKTLDN